MLSQKKLCDIIIPILEEKGLCCKKTAIIKARQARSGECIITITQDGMETINYAKTGDWVVENQTGAKEKYILSSTAFETKYKTTENSEGWNTYSPIGKVIAIEYSEDLLDVSIENFEAPWGTPMSLKNGDFLVAPLDKSEVYRVAKKEFEETYAPC